MKILSLDTTATVCTAAICEGGKLIAETTVNTGNTHSETLLPVIENLLKITETDIKDIDCFACSTGPGSFTGVRIGAATVKGLAFGSSKPCVGVSTLEALAYNMRGYKGIICPVMNARRSQVYTAIFESDGKEIKRISEDMAIAASELDIKLSELGKDVYLVGDGIDVALSNFVKTSVCNTPEEARYQSAYSVSQVALKEYKEGRSVSDKELVATYLRLSQAERERLERENK